MLWRRLHQDKQGDGMLNAFIVLMIMLGIAMKTYSAVMPPMVKLDNVVKERATDVMRTGY